MSQSSKPPNTRKGDRDRWRAWAHALVDEILDLREMTAPEDGDESAKDKDERAVYALSAVGHLSATLAEWATLHEIGLASENLKHVQPMPAGTAELPDFLATKAQVDDHRYEEIGARLWQGGDDPKIQRAILVNLLNASPGVIPRKLAVELLEALQALEFGEVRTILSRNPSGNKRNFTAKNLQMRAVAFVEYWYVRGTRKIAITKKVAQAFGVGIDAVNGWGAALAADFGAVAVTRVRLQARRDGLRDEELSEPGVNLLGRLARQDHLYDVDAIAAAGNKFQAELGQGGDRR